MNLHNIVSNAIGAINPNVSATIQTSAGYVYDESDDGTRIPSYNPPAPIMVQVQALTTRDLMQLDGLNISGSTHKIYLSDPINGVVRSTNKGGDLVTLHHPIYGDQTYLITAVLEQWPAWTAATATLQSA